MNISTSLTTALVCFLVLVVLGIAIPMFAGAFAPADLFLIDTTPYWEIGQEVVKACVYALLVCAALTTRLLMRLNKLGIYTLIIGSGSATTAILGTIQEPLVAFATMILATVATIKVFEASRKGDFGGVTTSNEEKEQESSM